MRAVPDLDAPTGVALPADTAVSILSQIDGWAEITWEDSDGATQQGWVGIRWLAINGIPLSEAATTGE